MLSLYTTKDYTLCQKKENNIFDGDSYKAIFARLIYKFILSHKWNTYEDMMADVNNLSSARELEYSVSDYDGYGEFKKAFGVSARPSKRPSVKIT